MNDGNVKSVADAAASAATRKWIAGAIEDHDFRDDFLLSMGWCAVPVESALHFAERDAEPIANAAHLYGKTKLLAVLIEKMEGVQEILEVIASKDGLLSFSRECAHFNYVLVPEDHSFAVICTTHDYYVIAGPRPFVELAVGKTISEVRAEFQRFAEDQFWSQSDRVRLLNVYGKYGGE